MVIATKGTTVLEAENLSNVDLQKISNCAENSKMEFNEQKSKTMLITRKKRPDKTNISIYLNNKQLKEVDKIKYLGIVLDKKYTFNHHIDYISEKCKKLIHVLSRSARISWGVEDDIQRSHPPLALIRSSSMGASTRERT